MGQESQDLVPEPASAEQTRLCCARVSRTKWTLVMNRGHAHSAFEVIGFYRAPALPKGNATNLSNVSAGQDMFRDGRRATPVAMNRQIGHGPSAIYLGLSLTPFSTLHFRGLRTPWRAPNTRLELHKR